MIIIIIHYIYIAPFWTLKALHIEGGISSPEPLLSRTPTIYTRLLVERRQSDEANWYIFIINLL